MKDHVIVSYQLNGTSNKLVYSWCCVNQNVPVRLNSYYIVCWSLWLQQKIATWYKCYEWFSFDTS